MRQANNSELTLSVGQNCDLKANVSGTYPLPGGVVYVNSWLKSTKYPGGNGGADSCVINAQGEWAIQGFTLLQPEFFSEKATVCCVQAVVYLAGTKQFVCSPVTEIQLEVPYGVDGQKLKVTTYNGLVSAMRVTEAGERSNSIISLENNLVVQRPVSVSLTCELQGGQHTLACIARQWNCCLFSSFGEKAVFKEVKIDYPDWLPKDIYKGESGFAGIVRELKGHIEDCDVSLDVELGDLNGAGIALEAAAGSAVKNCRVNGNLKGRCVGGVAYKMEQGNVTDCQVKAGIAFQENGGGIVCLLGEKGEIGDCHYEGDISCGTLAYSSARLAGGIAALAEIGSKIGDCRVDASFNLHRSGFGGYAGGIAGKCVHSEISCCGVKVKIDLLWTFGGIAGIMADAAKISECVVNEKGKMGGEQSVVGGLTGEIGAQCLVCDSYASQFLKTSAYAGGLVAYAAPVCTGAKIERCYCTSGMDVKAGGGIKMQSVVAVENCAAIHSFLSATGEIGRIGLGGNVKNCIGFKGTQTGTDRQITDTGETLHEAKDFSGQSAFNALGWDFTNIWEMAAAGKYPKLRRVASPQYYTYPFLWITPPASGDTYRFKADQNVQFSGCVNPRATFKSCKIDYPENVASRLAAGSQPVIVNEDEWTLDVGRLPVGRNSYNISFILTIDGVDFVASTAFIVE